MAKATKPPPRGPERSLAVKRGPEPRAVADAPDSTTGGGFRWRGVLASRWLITATVVGLIVEGAVITWFRTRPPQETSTITKVVPLGTFEFNRSSGRDNRLYLGQFDLFVRLGDDLSGSQQRQFEREQQRLQQTVEDTLRRLRAADLTDPRLVRLKNHVQERLNDELGFEGVAEVLIANFTIKLSQQTVTPAAPRDADSSFAPEPTPTASKTNHE